MGVATWSIAVILVGVLAGSAYLRFRRVEVVYPWEAALLYVNGAFVRQLATGRHALGTFGRSVSVQRAPLYPTPFAMGAVEVTTADRFSARLHPTAMVQITDARAIVEGQHQHLARLKLAAAEVLAAEVAKRPLEALLTEVGELGPSTMATLNAQFTEIELTALVIPGIQLPPETRRLTTEVERAKLEGQAALERARGEHASLRALANAARLAKDNPELIRLRTLQAVSQAGKGATVVLSSEPVTPIAPRRAK